MKNVKVGRSPAAIDIAPKTLARYNRIVNENFEVTLRVFNADEYID